MEFANAGLKHRPFHAHGKPVVTVQYSAERAAQYFLTVVNNSKRGIGFLFGPSGAGKRTSVRAFVRGLPAQQPAAVIDGAELSAVELVAEVNSWFGCQIEATVLHEAIAEIEAYVTDRAHYGNVPFLAVYHLERMRPDALSMLCGLAELRTQDRPAIRMVLMSDESSFGIINAPAMRPIAERMASAFQMSPLQAKEARDYLHAKLFVSGHDEPGKLFPEEVCDALHSRSSGWPGRLDRLAMQALDNAGHGPVRLEHLDRDAGSFGSSQKRSVAIVETAIDPDVQKLFVTLNRRTIRKFDLTADKVLIGRAAICDVCVDSRFVSKHHALLVREPDAMHLVDLDSTNGTFVNSERIGRTVLRHDDVISLGNHGIKLVAPAYRKRRGAESVNLADTATLQSLNELRQILSSAKLA